MNKIMFTFAMSLVLVGCASSPDKIGAAYVSPLQYQDFSCDQITAELSRVSRKANELRGNLKSEADSDTAQMAVGLVLFWPALFFLEGGDDARATEYARLKGEFEALEVTAIQKKCGLSIQKTD